MKPRESVISLVAAVLLLQIGCSGREAVSEELKHFPLDTFDNVLDQSGVVIDRETSSDGKGSLRYTVPDSTTIRLVEIGDVDVENARLVFRAHLKTADLEGQAYLEMLCRFPGKGEFFSRGLDSPVTGTTDWTTEETPFFLRKGENPDLVKLNLVVDGSGTVWIDDAVLLREPLPQH
jgi:hypothetical protein